MILAVIITYNPEMLRLSENINSIANQVDKTIIIDNNSSNIDEIENKMKINIIKNKKNQGIAYALKQAVNYAKANSYTYLLTLDQDSIADSEMVRHLFKGFETNPDAILISPSIFDLNLKEVSSKKINNDYEPLEITITSGSLHDVKKVIDVGNYDENLFIDCVDFEICLRAKRLKYKVILSKNALIFHEVGKAIKRNIFGHSFIVSNHSPDRVYYYFRNCIIIIRKYRKNFSKAYFKDILKLIKRFISICVFEQNKKAKLKKIITGIKHGFQMNI